MEGDLGAQGVLGFIILESGLSWDSVRTWPHGLMVSFGLLAGYSSVATLSGVQG